MPARSVPDRVRWAVGQLDLTPDFRVLEIGGGTGAAVELICARLPRGFLLGLDRSAVAVARSRERNRTHLETGRFELRQGALADLEVADGSFDLVFCLDVNLFWTTSAEVELVRLHRALRPGGTLRVMYGPMPRDPSAALQTVHRHLETSSFAGAEVRRDGRGSEVRATRAG